jgi:glucose-6-phosphate 1-dehydrogenase
MRHDELEAAWSWAEPILNGWQDQHEAPRPYAAGTWGPAASSALTARSDMQWAEEA